MLIDYLVVECGDKLARGGEVSEFYRTPAIDGFHAIVAYGMDRLQGRQLASVTYAFAIPKMALSNAARLIGDRLVISNGLFIYDIAYDCKVEQEELPL